ncbi:MAG: hypothetical protein JKY49_17675 [Cohaesibacteraceae bacterium]|nr:hypothetical protein [Cohaesibacteraceae bacterium]
MTYIIIPGVVDGKRHFAQVDKLEPDIEPTPWLSAMLKTGRCAFDEPGVCSKIEGDLITSLPGKVFVSEYPQNGVPDFLDIGHGWLISEIIKSKLAEIEPHAHDYFPIEVIDNDNGNRLHVSYILHLHQMPDVIDHSKTFYSNRYGSDPDFGLEAAQKSDFNFQKITFNDSCDNEFAQPLVNFNQNNVEHRHLWRGTVGHKNYYTTDISERYNNRIVYNDPLCRKLFVSDEFAEFILNNDITGWIPVKVLEETPEWYAQQLAQGLIT